MKRTFSTLEAPVAACVIRERNPGAAINAIRNGEFSGAAAFDLHLSCLDDEYKNRGAIRRIVEATEKPILALNYNQSYDWSEFATTEDERIGLLTEAAEAGVSAVDIQGYSFDLASKSGYTGSADFSFTRGNPKEIVTDEKIIGKQTELIAQLHRNGTEVLLSTHTSVPMNCGQVVELAKYLEYRNPDIIKLVTPCENDTQLAEAFKTMIELKNTITARKIHYHCSGKAGRLTRIINPMLGAYLAFCTERYTESSNREQLHLKTVADIFDGFNKLI